MSIIKSASEKLLLPVQVANEAHIHRFTAKFTDPTLEEGYIKDKCERWYPVLKGVVVMILLMIGIGIATIVIYDVHRQSLIIRYNCIYNYFIAAAGL